MKKKELSLDFKIARHAGRVAHSEGGRAILRRIFRRTIDRVRVLNDEPGQRAAVGSAYDIGQYIKLMNELDKE
jgi:hypothetical protein